MTGVVINTQDTTIFETFFFKRDYALPCHKISNMRELKQKFKQKKFQ